MKGINMGRFSKPSAGFLIGIGIIVILVSLFLALTVLIEAERLLKAEKPWLPATAIPFVLLATCTVLLCLTGVRLVTWHSWEKTRVFARSVEARLLALFFLGLCLLLSVEAPAWGATWSPLTISAVCILFVWSGGSWRRVTMRSNGSADADRSA